MLRSELRAMPPSVESLDQNPRFRFGETGDSVPSELINQRQQRDDYRSDLTRHPDFLDRIPRLRFWGKRESDDHVQASHGFLYTQASQQNLLCAHRECIEQPLTLAGRWDVSSRIPEWTSSPNRTW